MVTAIDSNLLMSIFNARAGVATALSSGSSLRKVAPTAPWTNSLSAEGQAELSAQVLNALVQRAGVDPALVEDVILGCLDNVGPQAGCIARTAWLAAGWSRDLTRSMAGSLSRCAR